MLSQSPVVSGGPRQAALPRAGSVADGGTHRAGGPGDDLLGLLDVVGVQVGHLLLRDLAELGLADRPDLVLLRYAGTLGYAGRLDQQSGRRRRLEDEREGPV